MATDRPRSSNGLPPVERMFQPRGTLTEKERAASFERDSIPSASPAAGGAPLRITSKADYANAPSGTRDLKDYDQPAYLRRGIPIPPVDDNEEYAMASTPTRMTSAQSQDESTSSYQPSGIRKPANDQRDHDDRPAFLKRIMD